ncbi:Teichoic acid biosynthesis protein C (Precursor) [Streptomyces naphthomycinicus]|uniref:phage baseplate protein n=1 Tax=Streptomyces naphthomycinicus TaxID=2872625 RepID=UPI001CED2D6A|nr:Teichoic acid biosynthesis protein C (Precursor) [Streptomyces sp. TML10]
MEQPIDLAAPAVRRLRERHTLREPTVLQSFAFDDVHHHLYVLQLTPGGRDAGDLCLNRLDQEGGHLGHMYLKGFGHGVSMGVQHAADGTVWIWTETDALAGYGRGVTRFRFVSGATRTPRDVKVRHPVEGSRTNQPTVCPATGRLAVRYRLHGGPRYRIWDLAAFTARDYASPLADLPQTGAHPDPGVPFQGFALHGDHLYQLAGSAYDPRTNPPAGHGDTWLSCLDIRTGELLARHRTEAAWSLDHREPEGLAVRSTGTPRLYMGFASGREGARKFSLYYKPGP